MRTPWSHDNDPYPRLLRPSPSIPEGRPADAMLARIFRSANVIRRRGLGDARPESRGGWGKSKKVREIDGPHSNTGMGSASAGPTGMLISSENDSLSQVPVAQRQGWLQAYGDASPGDRVVDNSRGQ